MARKTSYLSGILILLYGALGFIQSPVLGLFDSTPTLAVWRIVTGLVLLWGAALGSPSQNVWVLKVFGIIYTIAFVLGLMSSAGSVTSPDNMWHFVLAILLLWGGFFASP